MIARARTAAAHAERGQHGLLGEDGELAARGMDAHLAPEAESAAPPARPAGILAERRGLDANGIELLHRLDGLERGHVALGPRAHRVVAVAVRVGARAPRRILVEDEGLAGLRIGPADVAVI